MFVLSGVRLENTVTKISGKLSPAAGCISQQDWKLKELVVSFSQCKPRVFNSILIVVNHGKALVEAYHKGYNQRGSLDNNICNISLQILLSSFTIGLFVAFEMCGCCFYPWICCVTSHMQSWSDIVCLISNTFDDHDTSH